MEPPFRKARRNGDPEPSKKSSNAVRLEDEAARLLKLHAKKLRLTERKFASAAISYFAETGLDPTIAKPSDMTDLSAQLTEATRAARKQSVDVGNHLLSMLRWWEKHLYAFLQQQQAGTLNYLEQIENGILRHQVAVENTLLYPLVELLLKGNVEATVGREVAEKTNLRVRGIEQSSWPALLKTKSDERDQQAGALIREFLETHRVPKPTPAPKPMVAPVPAVVSAKVPAPAGTRVIADVPK